MRANDVLVVILERLGYGILDGLQPGKMHHRFAAILRQHLLKRVLVANVTFNDRQRLAADLLDALESHQAAVGEIVEHDDLFTSSQQRNACV